MQHFVYSEAGYNHLNEDTVVVQSHPEDPKALLCALADGQGGNSAGAEASRIAVEKCLQIASSFSIKRLFDVATWYSILSAADEAVCDEDEAGLTTLIGLCISEDRVCGASCGDSAAQLISSDQSSLLTEGQRKNPPVGSGAAFPVAFEVKLPSGWKLLLMSDGVWRYIGHEAIAKIGGLEAGHSLIAAIRQMQFDGNSGSLPDDFSIILLQQDNL